MGVTQPSVIYAIKSKKLPAKRDGYYWRIPLKTLEAYDVLRKKALSTSSKIRGIDSKAIALGVLEREISKTGIENIRISKNFEMFRGKSQKTLIDEKSVVAASLHLLHTSLLEKFEGRLFHDDIEMKFVSFMERLLSLKNFLERLKAEPKKLIAVKAIIRAVHSIPTNKVRLESCTGRIFTDQGPVFFGPRYLGQAQELIRGFCCQGEFTSQEIIDVLSSLQ